MTANATSALIHEPDASPEAAIIVIQMDNASGNAVFEPNNVTIRAGEEILIFNNHTSPQSLTNGEGSDDPMAGSWFDTDLIQPGGVVEYTTANLQDGEQYPFFSTAEPSATGTLIISGVIPEFGTLSAIVLAMAIMGTVVIMRIAAGRRSGLRST